MHVWSTGILTICFLKLGTKSVLTGRCWEHRRKHACENKLHSSKWPGGSLSKRSNGEYNVVHSIYCSAMKPEKPADILCGLFSIMAVLYIKTVGTQETLIFPVSKVSLQYPNSSCA